MKNETFPIWRWHHGLPRNMKESTEDKKQKTLLELISYVSSQDRRATYKNIKNISVYTSNKHMEIKMLNTVSLIIPQKMKYLVQI